MKKQFIAAVCISVFTPSGILRAAGLSTITTLGGFMFRRKKTINNFF
jgi:LPXTG-motif cell wall-anchored protein